MRHERFFVMPHLTISRRAWLVGTTASLVLWALIGLGIWLLWN